MSDHKARIISGIFKRRVIRTPNCRDLIRPTTDAVRELIFNVLENSLYIDINAFDTIDICAGSGAFGLEALSRGSESCIFIDSNPASIRCINNNIKTLGVMAKCRVLKTDIQSLDIGKLIYRQTIAFIDPPYANKQLIKKVIENITALRQEILCVIESDAELNFITPNLIKRKGGIIISFLRLN